MHVGWGQLAVAGTGLGRGFRRPRVRQRELVASTLILGARQSAPSGRSARSGLKDTYGIEFNEFKPLDSGGPLTVAAVKDGDVQVGVLYTSDPAIAVNGFVLLEDDKHLQLADNLIPIVRQEVLDADTDDILERVLNDIMAKLTQAGAHEPQQGS